MYGYKATAKPAQDHLSIETNRKILTEKNI